MRIPTSDVFDWMRSVTPGGTQDLSTILQMLREHYCGSFTFWEQRNMVENLHQGACEDATDFMIRVGSSISNLPKDWKGVLTEAELQSLQYEVSLNGVREEIRHVLDHKTTAFTTSVKGSPDPALSEQEPSLPEDDDHLGVEPTQEEDEGLYIQCFLEEALGGEGNLQIKMAHTIQAQERQDKKCFICQSGDHLMKDHHKVKNGVGPLQPKGSPQNKLAHETAKASLPS